MHHGAKLALACGATHRLGGEFDDAWQSYQADLGHCAADNLERAVGTDVFVVIILVAAIFAQLTNGSHHAGYLTRNRFTLNYLTHQRSPPSHSGQHAA